LCRYCGSELPEDSESAGADRAVLLARTLAVFAAFVVVVAGSLGFLAFHELKGQQKTDRPEEIPVLVSTAAKAESPTYQPLGLGETIEWTANADFAPITRQAGPYVLEVSRRDEKELAAPVVKLSVGAQSVSMNGDLADSGSPNRITLLANRSGSVPVVMLQSFSGGAHCCNHIQLAGFSGGTLKVVDLGQWDGDEIEPPKDVSGDGVADFVMRDNRFFYAFASYAQSDAPSQILNVVGGKVVDVSRNPKFRSLYEKDMETAGEDCRPGLGLTANGACPAFVAAAARVGKLDDAWAQMLAAYDATVEWQLPTGCWTSGDVCPPDQQIVYKSYPEALQAFLVKYGYIPKRWLPPEQRQVPLKAPPQVPDNRSA
jgi:hypothetical protein